MSENPLWDFSLAVYGRPGVPAACLDLQDRLGQDVNLLLFAAWAGMDCNADLPAAELERIDSAVAPWRAEVVRPLRAVRRRVKGEDDALYRRMKAAELEAERVQQDRLFALSGLTPAPGGSVEAAAANLCRLVPDGDPALMALLAALGTPPEP
ncbi:TIGR02444 family protein [Roseomonas genomospecies 6]|uniref:TIGR02444 family protein n=1 Tax=Roseomonas genomospecies 6 TaxID=214106 RepID=A0A9W7NN25_9PROT|nr:TIGR02444 family protein [Roseomonas genomospecies 6]KAA0683462.1 TIGR02444 family protein [Roseomonas genomospecies 6]